MKKLLLILFLVTLPVLCSAQRFNVKVVGISDGDAFTGLNSDNLQLKFRINGIDAPEKKQAFGNRSKEYLSSLIFGKNIVVDVQSLDNWGRFIANVYTPDGRDVSMLMIDAGMAWHFTQYDDNKDYSVAEKLAHKAKRGLWSDASPIAPWDFRAESKKKQE